MAGSGKPFRFGSVCSGIGAPEEAWKVLGWVPVFTSEIDPNAARILAARHPGVPNHGDMTKFREWPDHAIDLLVGGTPCQSFSIAGLRAGLADPRGNLMLTFGAVAERYKPRLLVWENVPGVLSSNGGRDFGTFLGMLGQLGYGTAYRVLDAQYVRVDGFARAVPQRRRRVIVVGCLGDWRRAAAILFEPESLQGHPAPRRQTGQDVAPTISSRPTGGGGLGTDFDCDGGLITSHDVACTLTAREYKGALPEADLSSVVAHTLLGKPNDSRAADLDTYVAHTLRANHDASEDGTGRGTPLVPIAFNSIQDPDASGDISGPLGAGNPQAQAVAHPLTAGMAASAARMPDEQGALLPIVLEERAYRTMSNGKGWSDEGAAYTLESRQQVQAVAFDMRGRDGGAMPEGPHDTANIRAANGGSSRSYVAEQWAVRRLTPVECERLQGFPEQYTDIPPEGKNHTPDGHRYKALGNSMAVNKMRWLGQRIDMVEAMA